LSKSEPIEAELGKAELHPHKTQYDPPPDPANYQIYSSPLGHHLLTPDNNSQWFDSPAKRDKYLQWHQSLLDKPMGVKNLGHLGETPPAPTGFMSKDEDDYGEEPEFEGGPDDQEPEEDQGPPGMAYHVTGTENLPSIMKLGLGGHAYERQFFWTNPADAKRMHKPEIYRTSKTTLAFPIPKDAVVATGADFGNYTHSEIPANQISVYDHNTQRFTPLAQHMHKLGKLGKAEGPPEELAKTEGDVYWHGTPSGDLRGGTTGLHVGTRQAAEDALHARIGVPVEGTWDGTREYGKTLLAGQRTLEARGIFPTGYNAEAPEEDHFPTGTAAFSSGEPVLATHRPNIIPVRIKGPMTNTPYSPHSDARANAMMQGALKRKAAKKGYYYQNEGEDPGSVSAVLPGPGHVELSKSENVKPDLPHPEWVPSSKLPARIQNILEAVKSNLSTEDTSRVATEALYFLIDGPQTGWEIRIIPDDK